MTPTGKLSITALKAAATLCLGATVLAHGMGQAAADGPYLSLSAGANFLSDVEAVGGLGGAENRVVEFESDPGPAVGGAIGYRHGLGAWGAVRGEAEIAYRTNGIGDLEFNSVPQDESGSTSALSGMVNLYYDLTQWNDTFVPYLGAGVGVADVGYDIRYGGGANIDDSDTVLAYQVMGGIAVKASDALEFFVEGRYFATSDPELDRTGGGPGGLATTSQDAEYHAITALVGVRWTFN